MKYPFRSQISKFSLKGLGLKRFLFRIKQIIIISVLFVIVILNLLLLSQVEQYDEDLNSQHCFDIPYTELPSADDLMLVGEKNMFFIETSCKGILNSREACIVEAASRTNPDWTVVVMFTGPLNRNSRNKNTYRALTNMLNNNTFFVKINISTYTNNTPLETFFRNNNVNRSPYRVPHAVEALKLLTLYKFGGVYLDLDMMLTSSFNSLPTHFVARDSWTTFSTSIMAFSKKADMLDLTMRYYFEVYEPLHQGSGPDMLKKVFNSLCDTEYFNEMTEQKCSGIRVMDPTFFFPVEISRALDLFKSKNLGVKPGYAIHMWNNVTLKHNQTIPQDSAYMRLARAHCPTISNLYGDIFGL